MERKTQVSWAGSNSSKSTLCFLPFSKHIEVYGVFSSIFVLKLCILLKSDYRSDWLGSLRNFSPFLPQIQNNVDLFSFSMCPRIETVYFIARSLGFCFYFILVILVL